MSEMILRLLLNILVAPLSIINALIVSLGMNKKSEIKDTFDRLEDIWKEYNVYK